MRKIYSFMFALLAFCGLAKAQVVFDFTAEGSYSLFGLNGYSSSDSHDGDITDNLSTTSSDVTITVSVSGKSNANRMWSDGSLRLYGGTLTISAASKNIQAIKFTLVNSKWGSNTADTGTLETGSWTGDASTVVITIGGNTQIKKMEVFLSGDDTPVEIDWTSSAESPLTVKDAIAKAQQMAAAEQTNKDVYVKGFVTQIDEIAAIKSEETGERYTNATYFIADAVAGESNQLYVFRGLGLNGAAFTSSDDLSVGDEVIVVGKIKNYANLDGSTTIEFTQGNKLYSRNGNTGGDIPDPEYLELPSIARVKAAATADKQKVLFKANDLLVTYINGKNLYVFDGTDGLLIYGDFSGISTGDKITADIKGDLYLYRGLTEISISAIENLTVNSQNNAVTPQVVTIADITNNFADYENELVTIKELTPAATTWESRNLTFTDDSDNALVVRDNWTVAANITFDIAVSYDVTGFVAIYANDAGRTVQLFPRSAEDFDGDTGTIVYPDPRETSLDNPYSVVELRALNATSSSEYLQESAFVVGYIVGYINGSSLSATTAIFSAEPPAAAASTRADDPKVAASNFLLADDPTCTDIAAVVPIQLDNNSPARNDLNLADHPECLGTKVWLQGNVRKYMGVTGLHKVKHYSTDGVDFTGVESVQAETASKAIYTIAGQRMQSITKPGIYIIGNKKVQVE